MANGADIARKYRKISAINIIVALLSGIIVTLFSANIAHNVTRKNLLADAGETLSIQAETLTGMLDKYRLLPALLGRRPDIQALFEQPRTQQNLQNAKRIILETVGLSGAMDIVLIQPDGQRLISAIGVINDKISSNSQLITAPLQNRLGREMRVLYNGKRAYVFTSAVHSRGEVIGIIAIYVSLEETESHWSLTTNVIQAADATGRIVMSNREEWRLRPMMDIRSERNGHVYFHFGEVEKEYLIVVRNLPLLGWKLCVLTDTTPLRLAAAFWGVLAALACTALTLFMQTQIKRQYDFTLRERSDRATAIKLERIVRDRTRALSQTNKTLEREVQERRTAEAELRKTQNELVQTGKLAALGQMSTALSHEFNQPLSATKSYADNALVFLERGRTDDARDNIKRISTLADRMAEIAKHLRNFARKPNSSYGTVTINSVIEDSLSVLASRIRNDNAKIEIISGDEDIWARAGYVRLQQVMVNLVLNALDAMVGQSSPTISIKTQQKNGKIIITLHDHGPGIDPKILDHIFDPFFTTKEIGKGLGLGLSISYNIIKDFGGQLSATNHAEGGAEFQIILEEGERTTEAAE